MLSNGITLLSWCRRLRRRLFSFLDTEGRDDAVILLGAD